jgi:hypothetical protein
MINVVIAYDNEDGDLGDYFEASFNNIQSTCLGLDYILNSNIPGLQCEENHINSIINTFNPNPFIFIGLSHGYSDGTCLVSNHEYVSANNALGFTNSLFYTTACCAATQLGPNLICNGCSCFVGCVDSSYATYADFYPVYADCENYAIKEFLGTDKSIGDTYAEMQAYFDSQIDDLFKRNEILVMLELQQNKDCMTILGDKTLTRHNFMIV